MGLEPRLLRHAALRADLQPGRGSAYGGSASECRRRARKEPGVIGGSKQIPFNATEPFKFCPADGTRLKDPRPSGGVTCPLCGRSWYRNSAPAGWAAIVEDSRALVTVRAREPEKGRVDLPGGFLEVGEHPVDGARTCSRSVSGPASPAERYARRTTWQR